MLRLFKGGVYSKKYGNSDKEITSGAHVYSLFAFMGGGKAGSVARSCAVNITLIVVYKGKVA